MAPSDTSSMNPQLKVALAALGALAGAALVAWPIISYAEVSTLESPPYETLLVLGKKKRSWYDRTPAVTLRKYPPYLVAEVEVTGRGLSDATTEGFRQIFNFITGGNQPGGASEIEPAAGADSGGWGGGSGEKISMTTPVAIEMAAAGKHVVTFVMPSKYSKASLPKPSNGAIRIREVPGRFQAVLSWRGGNYPSEAGVEARLAELRGVLAEHRITPREGAAPQLFGYYPPFAVPAMKLYDVLLEVEYEAVGDKIPVVDVSKAPDGATSFADKLRAGS